MTHYVIELAVWMFPLFFVGCIIGALLRRNSGPHRPPTMDETG